MSVIYERASVRFFTEEGVTEEQVEELLRAAMAAPSAMNQQPWEFYVVTDRETLAELAETSPYAKPAGRSAVTIAVCTRADCTVPGCAVQDASAAIENLLLRAVELGLGGVWLGVKPRPDREEHVRRVLALPKGIEPLALVALGHPEGKVAPKGESRFDPDRVHYHRR